MITHTYNEYETVPLPLLQQFRAMRLRRYYTVAELLRQWKAGRPGLVTFIIAAPSALAEPSDGPVILGWCFILKTEPSRKRQAFGGRWHMVSYVRRGFRRQGVSKQVIRSARYMAASLWPGLAEEEFIVYPHDTASKHMLEQQGLLPPNASPQADGDAS